MRDEMKKVPRLRFRGFSEDWELCKLSGVIEKLSGGASIKPTDYLEDGIRTIPRELLMQLGLQIYLAANTLVKTSLKRI